MRKTILLISFAALVVSALYSQSFTLSNPNGPVPHNSAVGVVYPPSVEEMKAYIFVTNVSSTPKALLVKKEEIFLIPDTYNSFCWNDLCYPPFVYVAENPIVLAPGTTTSAVEFYGTYAPENNPGTSQIRYTFYDADNTNDSVSVVVHYIASAVGIEKPPFTQKVKISKPYPNPANASVSFDVNFPSEVNEAVLTLRNILGSVVLQYTIAERKGTVNLPITHLNEGIYFYSLQVNNNTQMENGRLVIRR